MRLSGVQERITTLRNSMVCDAMLGNYKGFKNAKKEYASLAVKNFESILNMPGPSVSAPLFSRWGMNLMYVRLRDLFRIKTADEKLLKKMGKENYVKQKIKQSHVEF